MAEDEPPPRIARDRDDNADEHERDDRQRLARNDLELLGGSRFGGDGTHDAETMTSSGYRATRAGSRAPVPRAGHPRRRPAHRPASRPSRATTAHGRPAPIARRRSPPRWTRAAQGASRAAEPRPTGRGSSAAPA